MFKKSKGYISLILLAMVPVVCFFTTLTSTLAWYAYNTNVNMTYVGTSVESSEQLQIGIKTDLDMTAFNMETEGDYAWAQPGSGLKNEALNFYLEKNGFATTELAPVTSAKYEDD